MRRSGRSAALNFRNHFGGHSVMVAVRICNEMSSQKTRYVESIIATTHQVRDTIILTDALEGAARQINESHRKIVMLAEHDHTCPPLGVTIAARVVQIDGGHHALQTITALYGDPKEIELPDSSIGLLQELVEYPHPLTSGDFGECTIPEVQIDPENFGGYENAQVLLAELSAIAPDIEYDVGTFLRRSLIPDPEVIFRLGVLLSTSWLGVKMAKATADALEPKLKRFVEVMCDTITKTAKNALPMTRPITYVVKVNGKPNIDFVVKSRDPDIVISAFTGDFEKVAKDVSRLRQRFDAEMIQYMLNEKGEWVFNFLLTGDGKTIGSKMSFNRRAVLLNEMEAAARSKLENGPNKPMDRSGGSAAS
jgi:hypothetical protein